jgi:hypothetical protein
MARRMDAVGCVIVSDLNSTTFINLLLHRFVLLEVFSFGGFRQLELSDNENRKTLQALKFTATFFFEANS